MKAFKNSTPAPTVPPSAIRMAKVGGTIALIAAAAISAQTLVSLGRTIGLHGYVAWLLPASLDVYAATAIWVGYRIPAVHPAASVARRDARLALSLTVCCNVLYHLLILAGSTLPKLLTDTLLLCVGALPPLVVERIFHLQMSVRNGDSEAAVEAETGNRKPSTPAPTSASGAAERKQPAEVSASAPASKPLPVPAPTGSPAASIQNRPAVSTASRHVASGPIPIQRPARLEIVRDWIKDAGGDKKAVPLKEIQDRFGVSQATASRMRDEAAALPPKPESQPEQVADEEPERAREAV